MDRRPRRKNNFERLIYSTMNFTMNIVHELAKDLSKELGNTVNNYSNVQEKELIETSKDLISHINILGVPKEDIIINLTENKLEIKVGYVKTEEGNKIRHNGKYNKLKKEIRLPKKIVVDDSTADLENGILTVRMPKKIRKVRYEVPVE
ncbi:Hsp20/alpha crystallin family protein [Methanobacterium oryzae]|uniref:Hsp20/alpha crystallin family protein n=1 Tax=Methanobacterium oryzae TaxID=69540 RepID=UPI003D20A078